MSLIGLTKDQFTKYVSGQDPSAKDQSDSKLNQNSKGGQVKPPKAAKQVDWSKMNDSGK